jgi:hypothetical protein
VPNRSRVGPLSGAIRERGEPQVHCSSRNCLSSCLRSRLPPLSGGPVGARDLMLARLC